MNATEWVWMHSKARGSAKLVLLAITRRMLDGPTPPLSVKYLAALTGLSDKTVHRSLDQLTMGDARELVVVEGGRGVRARYQLSHAASVTVTDLGRIDESPSATLTDRLDRNDQPPRPRRPTTSVKTTEVAGGVPSSNLHSTKDHRTTSSSAYNEAAEKAEAVEQFLTWVKSTYPSVNGGAQVTVTDRDHVRVGKLLTGPPPRTVTRLQQMAMVLWTITPKEDAYLASTDRSLAMLCHAADRLDRLVTTRASTQLAPAPMSEITARRLRRGDEALAHILAWLDAATTAEMGAVCVVVAEALRSGDRNLERLDALLVEAATAVVDVAACEAEATGALAAWGKSRFSSQEVYEQTWRAARATMIRKHAQLPDLFALEGSARRSLASSQVTTTQHS